MGENYSYDQVAVDIEDYPIKVPRGTRILIDSSGEKAREFASELPDPQIAENYQYDASYGAEISYVNTP